MITHGAWSLFFSTGREPLDHEDRPDNYKQVAMGLDPAGWWADIGPWGLVSIFVMLVLFGGLIPRWIHNQRVEDLRRENDLLRQMVDKRDSQVTKLVEQNEITVRLLEDIKAVSRDRRGAP